MGVISLDQYHSNRYSDIRGNHSTPSVSHASFVREGQADKRWVRLMNIYVYIRLARLY